MAQRSRPLAGTKSRNLNRRSDAPRRTRRAEPSVGPEDSAPQEERAGAHGAALPGGLEDAREAAAAGPGSPEVRQVHVAEPPEEEGPRVSVAEAQDAPTDSAYLPRTACAAALEDKATSDTSTTASASEPPPESPRVRWADVADSEEEDEAPSSSSSYPVGVQHGGSASSTVPVPAPAHAMDKAWRGGRGARQGRTQRSAKVEPALDKGPARTAPAWHQQRSAGSWAPHDTWGQAGRPRHWGAPPPGNARGGPGGKQAGWHSKSNAAGKPQCQFFIGIEEEPGFQVKRKLLGPHGQNMKSIAEKSGAKLRLRGRGSGFLEGPQQEESSDPLMLCVSAPDEWAYGEAARLARDLIESVHGDFQRFQKRAGQQVPELRLEVHEGPRPGSF